MEQFDDLDVARPLPPSVRARLATQLDTFDFASGALTGLDEPLPLPAPMRSRLRARTRAKARQARAGRLAYRFAIAASLVLVIATGAVLALQRAPVRTPGALGPVPGPTVSPDKTGPDIGHHTVVAPVHLTPVTHTPTPVKRLKAAAPARRPRVAAPRRPRSARPHSGSTGGLPAVAGIDLNRLVNDTVSVVTDAVGAPSPLGNLLGQG